MEENLMNEEMNENSLNAVLSKTFLWMFIGLLISAGVAWFTYDTGLFADIVVNGYFNTLLLLEVGVVLLFSFLLRKIPANVAAAMFFGYSFLNGLTLSVIFAVYEISSIATVFVAAAVIFGALALIGKNVKKDLSGFGIYLMVFLLVGIILTLINMFVLESEGLAIALDWGILIVFFGITIYDINKIKRYIATNAIASDKIHIYSAMELYLDFINIFLRLLSLFGKRK